MIDDSLSLLDWCLDRLTLLSSGPVEVFIIGAALSTTSLGTCTAMRKESPNQWANAIIQALPLLLSRRLLVR